MAVWPGGEGFLIKKVCRAIDWQKRGDARARMRVMIKHLLKMYKYPPDKEEEAIQKVVDQAERLSDDWAFEQP